jgi:DnaJ-class molecular chaperone
LAEQGLYAMNQNIRGNMLINVKITVPANLTPEQQQGVRNLFNIQ